MNNQNKLVDKMVGWIGFGGLITGYLSIVMALLAALNNEFLAGAVALVAAALAFGYLARAVIRSA